MHVFTQPFCQEQKVTQSQIVNILERGFIKSFPSLRLVNEPKLKSPVYPTVHPYLDVEYLNKLSTWN